MFTYTLKFSLYYCCKIFLMLMILILYFCRRIHQRTIGFPSAARIGWSGPYYFRLPSISTLPEDLQPGQWKGSLSPVPPTNFNYRAEIELDKLVFRLFTHLSEIDRCINVGKMFLNKNSLATSVLKCKLLQLLMNRSPWFKSTWCKWCVSSQHNSIFI